MVIEEIDSGIRPAFVELNNRNLSITAVAGQTSDLKNIRKPVLGIDKTVFALSSNNATTVLKEFKFRRENPDEPIKEAELDSLVSKGLWDFLQTYRSFAAKKMGVTDLETVLADIEVVNVALNGKNVLNPSGLRSKDFNLKLRGTFVSKRILPKLQEVARWSKSFRIVERLAVVSLFSSGADLVALVGNDFTSIFSFAQENEAKFKKNCRWGLNKLIDSISAVLAVDKETAVAILDRFLQGKVSPKIEKAISNELTKNAKPLFNSLKKDLEGRKKAFISMPRNIFMHINPSKNYNHLDFKNLLEKRGFSVNIDYGGTPQVLQSAEFLAIVHYPLFTVHYDNLNKMLKRRSKWII